MTRPLEPQNWELDHHKELAQQSQRLTSLEKRMESVERMQGEISSLATSVAVMSSELSGVKSDTQEIKDSVNRLSGVPGSRWEAVVKAIITALIGGILALAISRLGV